MACLSAALVVLFALPASSQQPWKGLRIEPECDSSPYKEREYKKLYNQVRNPHLLDGLLARDGYLGRLESDGAVRSCNVTPPVPMPCIVAAKSGAARFSTQFDLSAFPTQETLKNHTSN